MLKPIKGCLFIRWLHSGLYKAAEELEFHSSEKYLLQKDIRKLLCKKFGMGGFVLTEAAKPIGYTIFDVTNSNLEIISLVIHQDYRRKGMASLLVDKLATRCWETMTVSIRESNLEAHLFFRSQGFKVMGFNRKKELYQFEKRKDGY